MATSNDLYDYSIALDDDGDAVLKHLCGAELGEANLCSLGELADAAERHDCEDEDDE